MTFDHIEYPANITELIGNTPLLELQRTASEHQLQDSVVLLAKLESFNPSASVKDRAALSIIRAAEKTGELKPGGTIVEATSGNMGIGLATCAAALGYKMIVTMPASMSIERRKLMAHLGVELELTDAKEGMAGAIKRADQLVAELDNAIAAHQFENQANPAAHIATTGPEIWNQTEGHVDVVIAGVGTGGTISGVSTFLKQKNPDIYAIAVEPEESAVLSGNPKGSHNIQGIGAGFVPKTFDQDVVDEIIQVSTPNAIKAAQELARTEGVLAGISSGAALFAAIEVAQRETMSNKTIVVILPDTGERYLSTALFEDGE